MKYVIISIDDSRQHKKDAIRKAMHKHEEVKDIRYVNGIDKLDMLMAKRDYPKVELTGQWPLSRGELGIWYSQLNCWKYAAANGDLIIFEDDAIVTPKFDELMEGPIREELPKDHDFFALFVPDNQLQDYYYNTIYDENGSASMFKAAGQMGYKYEIDGNDYVTRAYQGYSCVANMVSQKGARKMLDIVDRLGIYTTVDCFMFMEAHRGSLDAYAHSPEEQRPVVYDWNAPSIIHSSEFA